jgi:hypothetical protein
MSRLVLDLTRCGLRVGCCRSCRDASWQGSICPFCCCSVLHFQTLVLRTRSFFLLFRSPLTILSFFLTLLCITLASPFVSLSSPLTQTAFGDGNRCGTGIAQYCDCPHFNSSTHFFPSFSPARFNPILPVLTPTPTTTAPTVFGSGDRYLTSLTQYSDCVSALVNSHVDSVTLSWPQGTLNSVVDSMPVKESREFSCHAGSPLHFTCFLLQRSHCTTLHHTIVLPSTCCATRTTAHCSFYIH